MGEGIKRERERERMGWKRVGTCDDLEQKGLNCLEGMSDETERERERERNAKKMIARVEAEKKNQPLGVKAKRKKKIKEKG